MVRRSGDCIMIAATLRHTAAAVANVNSEIHIATDSLFLLSLRLILLERAVNAEPCDPFRELSEIFRYYDTFFRRLMDFAGQDTTSRCSRMAAHLPV
jgi:hypothetical protein